ncbi:hypothetical protein BaRGS_00015846 [Batillaria attramentaria]|uniref:Phospholipid scramblase n=1 Tax=Batillaria attramentaria TaxID=370345 RepID=A0ABD0L077_9CAEN
MSSSVDQWTQHEASRRPKFGPMALDQFGDIYLDQPGSTSTCASRNITEQPEEQIMLSVPPDCPSGMHCLCLLDQVLIQQDPNPPETCRGCGNGFKVTNDVGQQVLYAREESSMCMRVFCGSRRGFVFHVRDNAGEDVFVVRRPFKWCKGLALCSCQCCTYYASVEDGVGKVLGFVSTLFFCLSPMFLIHDADQNVIAQMGAPCQTFCCDNINLSVVDVVNDVKLGRIRKERVNNAFSTHLADYRVSFQADSDVTAKALIVGAVLVMDMAFCKTGGDLGGFLGGVVA